MNINKSGFILAAYSFFVFIGSASLSPYFSLGDQASYRAFFDAVGSADISEVLTLSRNYIQTSEPGYAYLMYFFAKSQADKDFVVSILNSFFLLLVLLLLKRESDRTHTLFFAIILSFYFLQLFFQIERLKVALIFVLLSLIVRNKFFVIIFASLAVLTHVQTIVLYTSFIFVLYFYPAIIGIYRRSTLNVSYLSMLTLALIISSLLGAVLWDHISVKLYQYGISFLIMDFAKAIVFVACVSLFLSGKYLTGYILHCLPVLIFILIFSGGRLIIFIYFMSFYYLAISMRYKRFTYLGFSLFGIYFGLKGLVNLVYSINYGTWIYYI